MKKEIKEKWIKALRSGEYKQGRYQLKNLREEEPHFCCLGVLSDLAEREGLVSWEERKEYEDINPYYIVHDKKNPSSSCTRLVESIKKWADLKDAGGYIPMSEKALKILREEHSEEEFEEIEDSLLSTRDDSLPLYRLSFSLIDLNDQGVNFKAIARIIEEFL